MGATERVVEYLENKGISKYKFCKELGFSNKFLDNSSNMGTDKACKILHHFPDINPTWLLTGNGEMLKAEESPKTKELKLTVEPVAIASELRSEYKSKGIPLIPIDALASIGTEVEYQISDEDIEERYIVPDFDRVKPDYLIRIKGSSMYPKYNSGDIIAIKRVDHTSYIQWNKPYVIDTISNGVMVKRIKQSEKDNYMKLISDNKDYDPFDVPVTDIRSISLVVGVIRLE